LDYPAWFQELMKRKEKEESKENEEERIE